ncbi:MAG: PA1571 family protein [Flavobacteriales bacterium]
MSSYPAQMSQSSTSPAQSMQRAYATCHLLDEQGREVQITERMILGACQALRQRCRRPKQL